MNNDSKHIPESMFYPYWNIYTRKYENEFTRKEIIRCCQRFNLVHWDCYEIKFEAISNRTAIEFFGEGNYYTIKITFYFGDDRHLRDRQVFYTKEEI